MKAIKYLNALLLPFIVLSLTMFSGCSDDDYDFNAIEPLVISMTGPAMVAAHGLIEFPSTYLVPHRGGSTFEWTVTSPAGNAAIELDSKYQSIAYITFPQSSDTSSAIISVVETTMGGKKSPAFTKNIVLTPFCPYDMNALVGNWTGTAAQNDDPLTAIKTLNLNELIIKGLAGFINFSWGENWTVGDGSCLLEFSCGELITINRQKLGETDYPDTYFIEGSGTFDPVNVTMTLTYVVFYTGGNTSPITTTLSRSGVKSQTNNVINSK